MGELMENFIYAIGVITIGFVLLQIAMTIYSAIFEFIHDVRNYREINRKYNIILKENTKMSQEIDNLNRQLNKLR